MRLSVCSVKIKFFFSLALSLFFYVLYFVLFLLDEFLHIHTRSHHIIGQIVKRNKKGRLGQGMVKAKTMPDFVGNEIIQLGRSLRWLECKWHFCTLPRGSALLLLSHRIKMETTR